MGSGPWRSRPSRGRVLGIGGTTTETGPLSGWVGEGESPVAEPTIVFSGHVPAWKSATEHWKLSWVLLAVTPAGSTTATVREPASPSAWSTIGENGVLGPAWVWPAEPMVEENCGSKGSAEQFVGV